ncbi:metallophosphoesterase [Peribacillus saganii]|uniref:Metallophosphoesterase n=1 Tax=Peribacillus saganii TaxID=2303992 RepID=A0A372LSC5_9BACI|nr:metallophosphoesterase [Peribacillus saganii]RFU71083.1 metallophosphoesterase [Peribacillus saganii]
MKKNISRRSFIKKSLGTLLTFAGFGVGGRYYAKHIEPHWFETTEYTITHDLIPQGFNNFKFVQFSDTHLGFQFQLEELRVIIQKINKLQPDAVFFTGDLLDEPNKYPQPERIIRVLNKLNAPHGKFCIFGNHDHGGNGSRLYEDIMSKSGFKILRNTNASISLLNGDSLFIAGIDEPMLGNPDINAALNGLPVDGYKILLSHAPDLADQIIGQSVQLQLSGHSHGGQVQIPFLGALVKPPYSRKYHEGMYNLDSLRLYVNRGLGTTRLPFRFLSRPEITLFKLTSMQSKK